MRLSGSEWAGKYDVLQMLRKHYGARAWWAAIAIRSEMRHLGGMIDQTYLPILRLVAEDAKRVEIDWSGVKERRRPIRFFDSPHTRWKKTYGNFVRELEWAYRELHGYLSEPDFEDLVVSTMGYRLDSWIGWTKRLLRRLDARAPGGLGASFDRPEVARMNAKFMAVASPIVGEIEVLGVENGVVVCYIPDCAMHKVVSDTEPQTYACLYGCKAACEAFMGPDDPMTIHFEPNLPAFDCLMRVGAGRSNLNRDLDARRGEVRAS